MGETMRQANLKNDLALGKVLLTLCLGVVVSLQSADGSGAQPLTLAQRKALLAQQQAQDKVAKAAPVPRVPRRPVAPVLESKSPSPETTVPVAGAAAAAPAGSAVKARAAALAAKVASQGGVPMPGQKLATCEGAGCRAAAVENLQAQVAAEQQQAAAVPAITAKPTTPNPVALQVAAKARERHAGRAVAAIPDLTPEQLSGKTIRQREAERLAALAIEQAAAKELADLAVAEAVRLEQEKLARLAAEQLLARPGSPQTGDLGAELPAVSAAPDNSWSATGKRALRNLRKRFAPSWDEYLAGEHLGLGDER